MDSEIMYLELDKYGWLYFGIVKFFNLGIHVPTLILLSSILFVALRFRKTWRDRKKM